MIRLLFFAIFILSLLHVACTKTSVEPIVEVVEDGEETPAPEPVEPKEVYALKTWSNTHTKHYTSSDVTTDLYFGSIWHLKDTSDDILLEELNFNYEPFAVHFLSNPPTPVERYTPSYNAMKEYAEKYGKKGTGNLNFHSTTFSDYAEIKRFVPNNIDVKKFLELAAYQDSTVTRKANTSLIRSESIHFSVDGDWMDYQTTFIDNHLASVLELQRSPYVVLSASYGKHHVIMAESDSTRTSINQALEKLFEGNTLTDEDEKALAVSKVVIYMRGGKKDSFIKKGEGLQEIRDLIVHFNDEWKDNEHQYDYPLYCHLMSLEDLRLLQYNYSFDYLVKENQDADN